MVGLSSLSIFAAYFTSLMDEADHQVHGVNAQSRASLAAHWAQLNVVKPLAERLQPPLVAVRPTTVELKATTTTTTTAPATPLTRSNVTDGLNAMERRILQRMMYWDESTLTRPALWPKVDQNKYLVFQTWRGGFNNERMSLELAFTLAVVLGRVLVFPPSFDVYLLDNSHLGDYFDLEHLRAAHPVMFFEDWLAVIGVQKPEQKVVPLEHDRDPVWKKIVANPAVLVWEETDSTHCWIYPRLPATPEEKESMANWCMPHLTVVDLAGNATLRATPSLFIPVRKLFDHFYSHFWFVGDERMREMMRAVRNYVHYLPRIFRVAARIVAALPPAYNALHVRRNDFQYEDIRELPVATIINNTSPVLPFGEPLFLATDNFTAAFAQPWRQAYPRFFQLGSFAAILKEERVPKIWMGLLDQLVLTQAKHFVGTRLSTFSAFAVRMRGFMGQRNVETYFTTDNLAHRLELERRNGVEGHEPGALLPTWRNGWLWSTWGRDFKEPFEFVGYKEQLVLGQVSP
jgi:hypothetical protein